MADFLFTFSGRSKRSHACVGALLFVCSWLARPATATIIVTNNNNAASLAAAVTATGGPGIVVTNASLSGRTLAAASSTATYLANGATYGLFGPGVVLSSGNALTYGSGPNTDSQISTSYNVAASSAQNALLSPISGSLIHFDVTEFSITFDTLPGIDRVSVNVVFGSEEFPEFAAFSTADPLGIFLNGLNMAIAEGASVKSNHPSFSGISGTELDGVLAPGGIPFVTYSAFVGSGSTNNVLRFVIADAGDSFVDSTAYLSGLGGSSTLPVIPEPSSVAIWALGIASLVGLRLPSRRPRRNIADNN
jgi:hypothetical protein